VVHHQHRAPGVAGGVLAVGVDEVDVHAIVVVAHALAPVIHLRAFHGIGRNARYQPVPGGMQNRVGVARGQAHVVHQRLADRRETQLPGGLGGLQAVAGGRQHRQAAGGQQADTPPDQVAPAEPGPLQNVREMFVAAAVGIFAGVMSHVGRLCVEGRKSTALDDSRGM